jgi:hypothetical protein
MNQKNNIGGQMTVIKRLKTHWIITAVLFLTIIATPAIVNHIASAAALGGVMVRFDRMRTSTQTTGTVCAKPTSTATEGNIRVTFPAGFTLGTAANFATSTAVNSNWPAGAAQWVSIQSQATTVAGQDVTWTSGDLTVGTLYCFNWTNNAAVQTASSASSTLTGTVATLTGALSVIDNGDYTTNTITDDQILVSASVPQTFSFALSGTSDNLGTLSTSSVATSPTPRTVTINTNAKNGWQVWAKDANTGLNSALAAYTIASTTPGTISTLVSGSEGYNMGVTATRVGGSGTYSVDTAFDAGATPYRGGGLDTSLRTIASSNGTADTAVLTLKNNASIRSLTPAASDYTDTITIVGAGLF